MTSPELAHVLAAATAATAAAATRGHYRPVTQVTV